MSLRTPIMIKLIHYASSINVQEHNLENSIPTDDLMSHVKFVKCLSISLFRNSVRKISLNNIVC